MDLAKAKEIARLMQGPPSPETNEVLNFSTCAEAARTLLSELESGKPRRIFAVVANRVFCNGVFSFKFMGAEGVPYNEFRGIKGFGAIVHEKETGFVSPDDDNDVFYVFEDASGANGQVYTSGNGVPFNERVLHCPEAVLLMNETQYKRLEKACWELCIPLRAYHYNGDLATS